MSVQGRFPLPRAGALLAALVCGAAPAHEASELSGRALVDALREGGYNIYFRHARTDWSNPDRVATAGDWQSCDSARMRQLSAQGREQARRLGAAIRALEIPVGRVLATEYCRARESAELMDLGPVETTRQLMNMRAARFFGGRSAVIRRARERLATPPEGGANTILVAHGNLLRAAAEVSLGESGAAVFAPQPGGTFALVARLAPQDWAALAAAAGRRQAGLATPKCDPAHRSARGDGN